jgi:transcriptional regulator with XRE-family HTH domain
MIHNAENIIGRYIRERREKLRKKDQHYSLRQVANRIGIEPSYLSKIERGERVSLSEKKIIALAKELN